MIDNNLDRQFGVAAPDKVRVTDITYIHPDTGGFAYLAEAIDLFSEVDPISRTGLRRC